MKKRWFLLRKLFIAVRKGVFIENSKIPVNQEGDRIQLGDTAYTLSACIYGEGSHFVTIVRDFSNNRLLYCDGMENNAQFVEYKATTGGLFPVTILRKTMQTAYYIRSEYADIVAK